MRNELTGAAGPSPRIGERRRGPERADYTLRPFQNYVLAFTGVARKQRLRSSAEVGPLTFRQPFLLTRQALARWNRLFGIEGAEAVVPFTFQAPWTVLPFHRILHAVGANYRNVMHVMSEQRHPGAALGRRFEPDVPYVLDARFDRLSLASAHSALLSTYWQVSAHDGGVLSSGREHFAIRHLVAEDRERLAMEAGAEAGMCDLRSLRQARSTLVPGTYRSHSLFVPETMGVEYGRLSGDMNIVHVHKPLARLFGFPRPFAQGLCTANYLLKGLVSDARIPVRALTLNYCRPVFLGQQVELRVGSGLLELADEAGALLVQGRWE